MRSCLAAFSLGVIVVGFFSRLPSTHLIAIFVALTALLLLVGVRSNNQGLANACLLVGCLLLGVLWHLLHARLQMSQRLPSELEGVDIVLTGTVASLPEQRGAIQQFRFDIDPDSGPDGFRTSSVLLNYYGSATIEPAQRWRFTVRLKRPHGFANPGTFDYEAWLWQQQIGAKGYVRVAASNQQLVSSAPGFVPKHTLLKLRSKILNKLISTTQSLPNHSIIVALTLGDRSKLTDQQWALFSSTGTNHLVVVSGLHVGFFAGVCYFVAFALWRLSSRCMLWLPAQKAGAFAAVSGALFYALLAGFGLPAQRALVMVSVFMLARIFSIRLSAAFSFLTAMVLVFVIDPLASVAAGFWLSFTAVAGLLLVFASEPVVESQPWYKRLWRSWGRAQLVVFVILAAPLISYVGELALWAPLVNALAIPLVSWLVVPLCMLALALLTVWPGAAAIIYYLVDSLLSVMTAGMEWFAFNSWFPASWHPQSVSSLMLVFTTVASVLLLVPLSWRYRLVACVLILPLIFPKSNFPQEGEFQLFVLDVGQGLATIIRTTNHVLVYDTGAGFEDGFNSGSQILRPVLSHLGVGKLDRLIVSHADNDHAGGAAALLESIGIERVLGGEIELSLNLMVEACTAGEFWQWDGVEFRILHPDRSSSRSYASANNRSCVLQVSNAEFSILLPGDIEASVENQLASQYGESLHSDVLVAAHHGSNTSSSSRFIAAVEPQVVVFSAGYRSQFGHPTEKVQGRFKELGASLLNTAETGMISFTFPGSKEGSSQKVAPIIEIYRKQHPKYWN